MKKTKEPYDMVDLALVTSFIKGQKLQWLGVLGNVMRTG